MHDVADQGSVSLAPKCCILDNHLIPCCVLVFWLVDLDIIGRSAVCVEWILRSILEQPLTCTQPVSYSHPHVASNTNPINRFYPLRKSEILQHHR